MSDYLASADQLVECSECGHPWWLLAEMGTVELFGQCPECGGLEYEPIALEEDTP